MSIKRQFDLSYFPNGNENLILDGAPIASNSLVLFVSTEENGVPAQMFPLCYVPEDFEADEASFYIEHNHADLYEVTVGYNSATPKSIFFQYVPYDASSCVFYVDDSAMSFIGSLSFSSNGIGETPSSGGSSDSLLTSFNGHFATFKDGTLVKVKGFSDRSYTVSSSTIGLDDSVNGRLMINYNLIDNEGKKLLVPFPLVEKA